MTEPYFDDGQVQLFLGDCLDVLPTLPDASIDAVVCDPPYSLPGGFMGREWDRHESPRAFQEWCEQWAAECWRVLKPGGHLLAFGAPRTYHRLAAGIEDAGFEVRDSIHWVYGCLAADTEILTEHGWKPGIEARVGERVAQWNHATGEITLAPVEQTYRAPWNGPMRVLRNHDTDQILTPNHRVYHRPRHRRMANGHRSAWYEDAWQVSEAGALSTWNPLVLPLAGEHAGPGIGGEDYAALLGWVWTEGGFDSIGNGTGVRIYQSSVNAAKVNEIAALMDRIGPHKRYDRERTYKGRTYTETMWFFSGDLARAVRRDLPGKRPTYELLWRMTGAEKRALLQAAMLGDGSGYGTGREQFHQKAEGDLVWLQTLLTLIGRSSKVGRRPDRPGGQVYLRDKATTELQARHLRDAWQHYAGDVWCVKVPTGAFVARRNGKVFITGNSGFPKSLDVSKAIDKAAGVTREVVGDKLDRPGYHLSGHDSGTGAFGNGLSRTSPETRLAAALITAPATDEAARWSGWGTALKPSHEPVVVARKALDGTVAANVLEHGTGALNIDGCRVTSGESPSIERRQGKAPEREAGSWANDRRSAEAYAAEHPGESLGRWPANLVLTHAPDCEQIGERIIPGDPRAGQEPGTRPGGFGNVGADSGTERPNGTMHGDQTVPVFACAPGCPVAELDRQSGVLTSGANPSRRGSDKFRDAYGDFAGQRECTPARGADSGGASRFFPVFRYEAKAPASERPRLADGTAHTTVKPLALMSWLVRLVCPPGGTVLDPFAGSGTTLEAALIEGFNAIGVEREPQYADLCVARLSKPIQAALDLGAAS